MGKAPHSDQMRSASRRATRQAAAAQNDPDLILPSALLELFESDQRAQLTQAKERFIAIYRGVKREAAANFVGERTALVHDVTAARNALRDADDQNDKLAADIQALQRQVDGALTTIANERRRSDHLEGQLAAAERAITSAQDAATHARSDQATVRSELASMTERALKAEMAIEQGRNGIGRARPTASRKSS